MSVVFKRVGALLLVVLFAALIIEIVVLAPKELNEPKKATDQSLENDAFKDDKIQQKMDGVHVVESQNDEKEWELWADKAVGFRSDEALAMNQVKAIFFGKNGVKLTVTGTKGNVEPKTKNMRIEGNVVTKSSNGYTFKTESVSYNSGNRQLISEHPVEVTGPRDALGRSLFIKGNEMEADMDKGQLDIRGDVSAQKTQNDKKMNIQSDRVALNGKTRGVQFSGNVQISVGGVRVSGPDAIFKYEKNSDLLKSIELDGGIKVSDVNKYATSEKLAIFLDEDRYVFRGRPRVVQENDELSGDEIVFLNGGKKVQVKNAKVKVSKERLEKQK